ncbi:hypothetical protein [Flavobacterium phycosphaerae]|nr:hypothetical protein [Flavobacterium phycosphaerae]
MEDEPCKAFNTQFSEHFEAVRQKHVENVLKARKNQNQQKQLTLF